MCKKELKKHFMGFTKNTIYVLMVSKCSRLVLNEIRIKGYL